VTCSCVNHVRTDNDDWKCTCRKKLRTLGSLQLGSWALQTSDGGVQDKARKVHAVGPLEEGSNFNHAPNIAQRGAHLEMFGKALSPLKFPDPPSRR
jgi:hypothetical protein